MKDYGLGKENIGTVHFIGIGGDISGVSMSGIAEVLLSLGCSVQGSDISESPVLSRLHSFGANISDSSDRIADICFEVAKI